ncbi:CBS domain-containing protein [Haloplanus natans]|uniref:CBS domain-containing protein n=1 Tax=Haloplanus natans TaxID=376171 RepID=UPI0006782893|nr:CBS domain-containing protein [Haloplanus natans]
MVRVKIREIDAPEFETIPSHRDIESVVEEMLTKKYSQMGVTKDGELIGVISFKSISRALLVTEELFDSPKKMSDRPAETAVEQPKVVSAGSNLSDLFDLLGERSYVLVEDEGTHRVITDYDIREFWRRSTEPFLLIEETELAIRAIIQSVYEGDLSEALEHISESSDQLSSASEIDNCTFGHYTQFISRYWDDGFDDYFDQRCDFVRELINKIGENRNRLFHFRIEDRRELDLDLIEFAHGYFTSLPASRRLTE